MIPPEYGGLATLARRTRHEPESVEILPGDVGRRRYIRLRLPGGRTVPDVAREAVFDLYLKAPLSPADRETHDAWADALSREIAAHPRALCHRDYHGNNLFPLEDGVAWIDFQDLRAGPDSYDIASLLWE